jgi:hypothetical protein
VKTHRSYQSEEEEEEEEDDDDDDDEDDEDDDRFRRFDCGESRREPRPRALLSSPFGLTASRGGGGGGDRFLDRSSALLSDERNGGGGGGTLPLRGGDLALGDFERRSSRCLASLALLRIARNDGVLLQHVQPVCGCCTMLWTAPAMAAMALNGSVLSGAESANSVRYSIASFGALRAGTY